MVSKRRVTYHGRHLGRWWVRFSSLRKRKVVEMVEVVGRRLKDYRLDGRWLEDGNVKIGCSRAGVSRAVWCNLSEVGGWFGVEVD